MDQNYRNIFYTLEYDAMLNGKLVDLTRFFTECNFLVWTTNVYLYSHGRRSSAKKTAFTPELQSTTTEEQRPAANNGRADLLTARRKVRQGVA
jgi:hypothetical protein